MKSLGVATEFPAFCLQGEVGQWDWHGIPTELFVRSVHVEPPEISGALGRQERERGEVKSLDLLKEAVSLR